MKTIIRTILVSTVIVSLMSCTDDKGNGLDVTDRSFEFSLSVDFNKDRLCHVASLTLLSGSVDKEYCMTYSIDGTNSQEITTCEEVFTNGSVLDFSEGSVIQFCLPAFSEGRHMLSCTVSSGGYRQELETVFNVGVYEAYADRFEFSAEVSTSLEGGSVLLLNLRKGVFGKEYTLSYDIDGVEGLKMKDVEGSEVGTVSKVRFPAGGLLIFTLPVLVPGEHRVTVKLADEKYMREEQLTFMEPMRFPELLLLLEYDGKYITCRAQDNPYNAEVALTFSATITADCTYFMNTQIIKNKAIVKTSSETFRFIPDTKNKIPLMDITSLRDEATSTTIKDKDDYWKLFGKNFKFTLVSMNTLCNAVIGHPAGVTIKFREIYKEEADNYWFGPLLK